MKIYRDGVRVEAFRFVQHQRDRLAGAAQLTDHEVVLRSEARAGIRQKDEPIGLRDGTLGLRAHLRFYSRRIFNQATGINHYIGNRPNTTVTILTITGKPRYVRDDCVASARQDVEEC